jgi:hypothetical protein
MLRQVFFVGNGDSNADSPRSSNQIHQIGSVGLIEDRERPLQTNPVCIFPDQPGPNSMEGAGPRQLDVIATQRCLGHFF